jgi:preprotein translocase SecE subunit
MAFGLYKPGQGYWVRVLTATMAGVLALAAAAWLWNEMQKAGQYIPRPTWTMTLVGGATGAAAKGEPVQLLGEPTQAGSAREEIGTASVVDFDSGANTLVVGRVQMKPGRDPSATKAVAPAPGGGATLNAQVAQSAGNPLFDELYLQAGGVAVLVLVAAFLIYWMVGVRSGTVEFLIATDGEMKKVNWSTRKDIVGSTWVVILWSVLLAAGLWAVDFLFSQFFKLIGVLQS